MSVVADTSVWVDYFSGRAVPELERSLAAAAVVLPPIVVAELLSGARKKRERSLLLDFLRELPVHPTSFEHWTRVGELRLHLRGRGLSVSVPDAHVAQCALELEAPLLTRDRIFSRFPRAVGLRVSKGDSPP